MEFQSTPPLSLDPLLRPRSIALVGASAKADTNGLALVQMTRIDGFRGRVYPVNPGYAEIEGLGCFPDLATLPERPDHVVLAIANAKLEAGLDQAIAAGAKAVTIFASGHLDDDRSPPLVERLRAKAVAAGVALCGPNCMGFYVPPIGLRVASFPSPAGLRQGGIAWLAQSGSAFSALCHNDRRLGFSLCVSTGAESVVTVADYMAWAIETGETRVVGLFLEGIRAPERFKAALAQAAERTIPVVALKVGRTAASAAMAQTHTGALAGNDAAYRALFRTYGVHQVDDLDEMAAVLALFDTPRRAGKGGLATLHNSGGEREMVVDLAERHGVPFGKISEATKASLAAQLDPGLHPENPLDAWGTARDFSARFQHCVVALSGDPDVAVTIFNSDVRDGYWYAAGVVEAVIGAADATDGPLAMASNTVLTANSSIAARLADNGIPLIKGTQPMLRAVRALFAQRDRRPQDRADVAIDRVVVARWRERLHSGRLDEGAALDMLADFGLDVPQRRIVATEADAVAAWRAIGTSVALKTAEDHAHKTEVGGVRLGLAEETSVRAAYRDLAVRLGPRVLVAGMAPKGVEVGVGALVDPGFGPVVMLSAGGTLIEVIADTVAALAPVSEAEARSMLADLRLARLLPGVRGADPADMTALARSISRFSAMVAALAGDIAEIDVNPVIVAPSGAMAVDCLVIPKRKDRSMDLNLTPRQKELAAMARKFAAEVLQPLELVVEEHGELPMERRPAVRQAVRDWGFAGINHTKEHGGLGLTMLEQTVIEEQLGQVTNGLWSGVWRPPCACASAPRTRTTAYLMPSNHGERAALLAITEPDAGSDAGAGETTARLRATAVAASPARSGSSPPTTPPTSSSCTPMSTAIPTSRRCSWSTSRSRA